MAVTHSAAPPPWGTAGPPPGGYTLPPGVRPLPWPPPVQVGPDGKPLAEFWQRLVAYLIDSAIQMLALLVPAAVVIVVVFVPLLSDLRTAKGPDIAAAFALYLGFVGLAILLSLVVSYVMHVPMMHRNGQTVGKRIMKIRVVRTTDGAPIDRRSARIRWLTTYPAGTIGMYWNYADGLWQLWDQPYRQCLHDKCAETVVVKVEA
jgi:uncharacterized RDD family membrane protein YckC